MIQIKLDILFNKFKLKFFIKHLINCYYYINIIIILSSYFINNKNII